jgi:hypothetical protein
MITIDELFAEPFEPQWLQRQNFMLDVRRLVLFYTIAALWIFDQTLEILSRREFDARIDYAYRSAATEQRLRLAERCDRKGNYANGTFFSVAK